MNNAEYTDGSGPFEARYLAFLETITNLRPSLHRYCSRMTGSVLDGEDVVQEVFLALFRHLQPCIYGNNTVPVFAALHLRKQGCSIVSNLVRAATTLLAPLLSNI